MGWHNRPVSFLLAALIPIAAAAAQENKTKPSARGSVRLPVARNATPPDAERGRIVVTIPDPDHYLEQTGKALDADGLPVLVEGRQASSLDHLRTMIKELCDPAKHPDKVAITPHGMKPLPVSAKTVQIHCDREQKSGWVLAVLTACTMFPDKDLAAELQSSPMVYRIELAVEGGLVLATDLPVDRGLEEAVAPPFAISLEVARDDRSKPARERRTFLRTARRDEPPVGTFTGIDTAPDGTCVLKSDPPDLAKAFAQRLAESGRERKIDSVRISSNIETPFACLAEVIGLARGDPGMAIAYGGFSASQLNALVDSAKR